MNVDLQSLLLYGGIALVGLAVVVAVVVLVILLVRRSSRADKASGPGQDAGPQLAATSPFATLQIPVQESSESSSLSAAFVAGPRQAAPTVQAATTSTDAEQSSESGVEVTPAPATPPPLASTVPAWHDVVASLPDAEPFQYTTGSFAAPSPLANPWAESGSQPQPPPAPSPPIVSPQASPVEEDRSVPTGTASDAAPDVPVVESAPPFLPPTPAPAPVPPPVLPAPVSAAEDDDDRTMLVAGRGPAVPPWVLILDSGQRIGVQVDSVILGRRPEPIEHGVPGLLVPDPTKTLSKVHARLDRIGEEWRITDLDSTNGTSLIDANGRERLLPRGGADVVHGRFLLGEVGLVLVRNPEAAR